MKRYFLAYIILSLFVIYFIPLREACGKEGNATISVNIPANQWKASRLKNLPRNTSVEIELQSSAPLQVYLLNQQQYSQFPKVEGQLFMGSLQGKLAFKVIIPVSGHYYLILDNRAGKTDAQTTIKILADNHAPISAKVNTSQERAADFDASLAKIITELEKLFIFAPFPMTSEFCQGSSTADPGHNKISICVDYIKEVSAAIGDQDKAQHIIQFVIFHEIGHILLYQWGFPFYDNEEIADEFATMFFVMSRKNELLTDPAEYFITNPSSNELLAKAFQHDRHPLSIQRARNIISWSKDADRLQRWLNIFIPHMQTSLLETLVAQKSAPELQKMLQKELQKRNSH